MHHHLRSAPSPPASPGTSIRRFYASGLIEAAEAGQLEEVEQALSRGIPVNSQTKHGTTALMKACEKGHLDITRKLLAAGADAAVTNHFGETAATLAASSNQPEAARLLPGGTHDYSEPNAEGKPCRQCFKVVGVGREGLFCRCCSLCKDCGKKTACGADVLHDPGSPAKVRRNGAVPHQWPARSAARPSPLAAPPRTSPLAAAAAGGSARRGSRRRELPPPRTGGCASGASTTRRSPFRLTTRNPSAARRAPVVLPPAARSSSASSPPSSPSRCSARSSSTRSGLGWRPPRLRSTSSRSEAHAPRNFLASSFSKLKLYFAAT